MGFLTSPSPSYAALPLITPEGIHDLLAYDMLDKLFSEPHTGESVDWTLFLTDNPDDLTYRRAVMEELSAHPVLVQKIEAVSNCLSQLGSLDFEPSAEDTADTLRDFASLSLAHTTLGELGELLGREIEAGRVRSDGLKALYRLCREKLDSIFPENFAESWNELSSGLDQMGSLRFRFTLDDELRTVGVALTAVQKERFVKGLGAGRVLKENRQDDKPWDLTPPKEMLSPLDELIRTQAMNSAKQYRQTAGRLTDELESLNTDLIYYLSALKYLDAMKKLGIPTVFADIRPVEEKAFTAVNMVNPVLALLKEKAPIANSISFEKGGELLVLTGINQGGKTTFLRTVGLLQLLFQLGWPVPAESAALSPVDRIVTVFSHEEDTKLQHGKLGQELKTIRAGLDLATPDCLVLFNEPVTGTSPLENLLLSREVLSACKLKGYHGVWVTHLYDLASEADEMNDSLNGSTVSSIVAVVAKDGDDITASYRIERGEPAFTSFAKEVLEKESRVNYD